MSSELLTCRELGSGEIPRSAQIVFDAFNRLAEQTGVPAIPEVGVVYQRLSEYLNDSGVPGKLYGAFEDGNQVGFFMLRKLGIDSEAWEISMLSVAPESQRKGCGVALLRMALQNIIELGGVLAVAAVTEGNDHVLTLFAREGFLCEASGIPVGSGGLTIWMLRKDMKNKAPSCAEGDCGDCDSCGSGCSGCG